MIALSHGWDRGTSAGLLVTMIAGLLVTQGCHWPGWRPAPQAPLPPAAFTGVPTLDEAIYAVNANSGRVRQLQTQSAALRIDGFPDLKADLALERPRRFRLRAELFQFTGRELDIGSNEDLMWVWVRRAQPAIYYAPHDRFRQAASGLIPVEPYWLVDALGLVQLDSTAVHDGPMVRPDGQLEIRSRIQSAEGAVTRVAILDPTYAWVKELHLADDQGRRLASARASQYRFYPQDGVSLPHEVQVEIGDGDLAFTLSVDAFLINRLYGEPQQMWALPQIEGQSLVDVTAPGFQVPVGLPPAAAPSTPRPGWRGPTRLPVYRGQ